MHHLTTVLSILAASCGVAHAGEPGPIFDPFGDAIDTFDEGSPLLDIDMLDVRFDATDLHVTMTFYTPIAPASAELPESIVGVVELDTDQNSATGQSPFQHDFAPPFADLDFGTEFICELFSEIAHPGYIDILNTSNFDLVATVPIHYTETSLQFSVPLHAIDDNGRLDFTSIIGTEFQPTDAMDVVGQSVPAPSALALLAGGAAFGARRRR
jgi:hypothetical protein